MARLCGRAGRLTALLGGSRPEQCLQAAHTHGLCTQALDMPALRARAARIAAAAAAAAAESDGSDESAEANAEVAAAAAGRVEALVRYDDAAERAREREIYGGDAAAGRQAWFERVAARRRQVDRRARSSPVEEFSSW
jgi:hypothetical protein